MHPPRVYTCSPSWTLLPPPSPYHPSGSSQCTSPKHPLSCIEPGLAIRFLYDIIHVLMPFSQIIPHSLSHRVQKTVQYICVSFCCLAYSVVITIFLNSIYMRYFIKIFIEMLLFSTTSLEPFLPSQMILEPSWLFLHSNSISPTLENTTLSINLSSPTPILRSISSIRRIQFYPIKNSCELQYSLCCS